MMSSLFNIPEKGHGHMKKNYNTHAKKHDDKKKYVAIYSRSSTKERESQTKESHIHPLTTHVHNFDHISSYDVYSPRIQLLILQHM